MQTFTVWPTWTALGGYTQPAVCDMSRDTKRYQEIPGDTGRYGRCREMQGDVGRSGEIWGDTGGRGDRGRCHDKRTSHTTGLHTLSALSGSSLQTPQPQRTTHIVIPHIGTPRETYRHFLRIAHTLARLSRRDHAGSKCALPQQQDRKPACGHPVRLYHALYLAVHMQFSRAPLVRRNSPSTRQTRYRASFAPLVQRNSPSTRQVPRLIHLGRARPVLLLTIASSRHEAGTPQL